MLPSSGFRLFDVQCSSSWLLAIASGRGFVAFLIIPQSNSLAADMENATFCLSGAKTLLTTGSYGFTLKEDRRFILSVRRSGAISKQFLQKKKNHNVRRDRLAKCWTVVPTSRRRREIGNIFRSVVFGNHTNEHFCFGFRISIEFTGFPTQWRVQSRSERVWSVFELAKFKCWSSAEPKTRVPRTIYLISSIHPLLAIDD